MANESKVVALQNRGKTTSIKAVGEKKTVKATTSQVGAAEVEAPVSLPKTPRQSKRKSATQITAEDRLRHIELAAYFLAEKRGFSSGNPTEDWYLAEQQIDQLLLTGQLGH